MGFDDIIVSANRVGCGSAPGTTDTPTTSTDAPTTSTTTTSTSTSTTETSTSTSTTGTSTSTTSTNCGYIPDTCGRPLTRMHRLRETKTLGKFEEITGVQLAEATVEDIQLYFHCQRRNPSKCTGLEKPCSCSSPPCICPGEEPPTTSTSASTTTIPSTTTSTTTTTTTTTTPGRPQNCVLKMCGCNLTGQSWCNNSNGWLATEWCHINAGNCL